MPDTDRIRDDDIARERSSARQRAADAFGNARDRASDSLGQAPLVALAGGLAAGAIIAALLPRTEAETRALRPIGNRVKGSARAAVDAAREAGSSSLNELGLTRDKGAETLRSILDGAGQAAKASAQAALDAARNNRQ